jgi:hypothetical protein
LLATRGSFLEVKRYVTANITTSTYAILSTATAKNTVENTATATTAAAE